GGIGVRYVEMQVKRQAPLRYWRVSELSAEIVGEHQNAVANPHFHVHQLAAGARRTGNLDGVEGALKEVRIGGSAIDRKMRGQGTESGWYRIGRFGHGHRITGSQASTDRTTRYWI